VRGLAAMQAWLHAASAAEIAATVTPYFEGMERALLEAGIARYLALGLWSATPLFPRQAFEALQAAMLAAGAIARAPGFAACVDEAIVAEALA